MEKIRFDAKREKVILKNKHDQMMKINKQASTTNFAFVGTVAKCLSLFVSFLLILASLMLLPVRQTNAATQTFSNSATVESDIRGLLQTAYDMMASEITFIVDGVDVNRKFFETDGSGNIIKPFVTKPIFKTLPDEQLMDMKGSNDNAYTRLALKSYGIQMGMSYTESGGVINTIKTTIKYTFTWHDGANAFDARNAVTSHAQNFLNSSAYTSQTTDYDKMKAINKYICETFQYDYRVYTEDANTIYTAYKMISDSETYKRGVCQAYAMYGYIILKKAGFENITIDGKGGANDHAWNMVKIGSNWYHIDYTWDDPVTAGNPSKQNGAGTVSENFLLRSDSEMIGGRHTWTSPSNGFTYPLATSKHPQTPAMTGVTTPAPIPTATPTPKPTKIPTPTPTKAPAVGGGSTPPTPQAPSISEGSDSSASELSESISINPSVVESESDEQSSASAVDSEQTVDISGQLLDMNQKPIPNYTIEIAGVGQSTKTDANGIYYFKRLKVGNYEMYVLDVDGKRIAQMPITITKGSETGRTSESVVVKGGAFVMNLLLDGDQLTIQSVTNPTFQMTQTMWIIAISIAVVVVMLLLLLLFKNRKRYDD